MFQHTYSTKVGEVLRLTKEGGDSTWERNLFFIVPMYLYSGQISEKNFNLYTYFVLKKKNIFFEKATGLQIEENILKIMIRIDNASK